MAPKKLPKEKKATEHLLVRKHQKRAVFAIADMQGVAIADVVEDALYNYITSYRPEKNVSRFERIMKAFLG